MEKAISYGYNGHILRINLSSRAVSTEPIDEVFCREYLGGAGFVAHFLLKELRPNIDALGPDNKIVFALGPLTATMACRQASRVCWR